MAEKVLLALKYQYGILLFMKTNKRKMVVDVKRGNGLKLGSRVTVDGRPGRVTGILCGTAVIVEFFPALKETV